MARHGTRFIFVIFVLCFVMPCMTITRAMTTTAFIVGDQMGWSTGVDYTQWASNKTFLVGDELVFNCERDHTVEEVNQDDYFACTLNNSITTYRGRGGLATIILEARGTRYFTSGLADQCNNGMKLAVTAIEAEGATEAPLSEEPYYAASSPSTLPDYAPTSSSVLPDYVPTSSGTTLSPFVVVLITWFALFKLVLY